MADVFYLSHCGDFVPMRETTGATDSGFINVLATEEFDKVGRRLTAILVTLSGYCPPLPIRRLYCDREVHVP